MGIGLIWRGGHCQKSPWSSSGADPIGIFSHKNRLTFEWEKKVMSSSYTMMGFDEQQSGDHDAKAV
eukprot:scaffold139980_cov63-Attheya_sp.AAC.1